MTVACVLNCRQKLDPAGLRNVDEFLYKSDPVAFFQNFLGFNRKTLKLARRASSPLGTSGFTSIRRWGGDFLQVCLTMPLDGDIACRNCFSGKGIGYACRAATFIHTDAFAAKMEL